MWEEIKTVEDIEDSFQRSFESPCIIFKHSTRCPVSSMAKNLLEKNADAFTKYDLNWLFLDLLRYRSLSDLVSEKTKVTHESPQIIFIEKGAATLNLSHGGIQIDKILNHLKKSELI